MEKSFRKVPIGWLQGILKSLWSLSFLPFLKFYLEKSTKSPKLKRRN